MTKPLLFAFLSSLLLIVACEQKPPSDEALEQPDLVINETGTNALAISELLWQTGQTAAFEALKAASALDTAIQNLLSDPSETTLVAAREQWQLSIEAFYRAQPFLVMDTTLVGDKRLSVAHWPFYPGFIDSYGLYRDSGLVNAIDTPLNLNAVQQYHQQYDDDELLLGFYPMAFLLWSEYEPRPAEDFMPMMETPAALGDEGVKLTQLPQNRRRQMLRLQSEWLLIDINSLYEHWTTLSADPTHLPPQRLRMITEGLLLSLRLMSMQVETGENLPSQLIAMQQAGLQQTLANIQSDYFDSGLAEYWLVQEDITLAQQLLNTLQSTEGDVTRKTLEKLVSWISPDTTQAADEDAPLSDNLKINAP